MNAFVLLLAAVSTGAVPVEFDRCPYHTVIMKDRKVYKGQIISEPGAPAVRIQTETGTRLLPRSRIADILPPVSLEEAHDQVAVKIEAGDFESWHAIARECLRKRPPLLEKAVDDLGRAIAANGRHAASHLLLTQVLLRTGEVGQARRSAERFREVLPRDADAHFITGKVQALSGEDPRDAFRAAIEIKPSVQAYLSLARTEISRGRFEEAKGALDSAQALSPLSVEIEAVRGDMALARGELLEAEALYEAACLRSEKERVRSGRKTPGADSARVGLASVCYLQGRFDEATKALLDADPTDPRVTWILGLVKLVRERENPPLPPPPPAETEAARREPQGRSTRRTTTGEAGEEEAPAPRPIWESERLFALAANDGFAPAHLGLGTVAFVASGGDYSAALPHFERAAKTDRGDAYAALLAAWSRLRLGKTEEAIAGYMHVTVLAPGFAGGYAALAGATLSGGSTVDAVRLYRAGLENCPEDPGLLAGLGLAQLAAGDAASAEASLEEARAAGFRGPDLYLGLGYLAHVRSDNARAADWFTWALTAASVAGGGGAARKAGTSSGAEPILTGGPAGKAAVRHVAVRYVKESLPRLYAEMGLKPSIFTFDEDGEPEDPFSVQARAGPGAVARGGRLVIAGKQEREGRRTNVVLPVDGALFRSAGADFELGGGDATTRREPQGRSTRRTTAGLCLASHTGAVEIARDPEAGIRMRFRDGRKAPFEDWRDLMKWPEGNRARLTISMIETGKNLARIELRAQAAPPAGGESAATRVIELKKAFWRERAFSVILFASSPKEGTVRAVVDNLVLVEQER